MNSQSLTQVCVLYNSIMTCKMDRVHNDNVRTDAVGNRISYNNLHISDLSEVRRHVSWVGLKRHDKICTSCLCIVRHSDIVLF